MSKGSIGGGVNISHKSKMSQSAKNQMSFPGGMPGPGDYGKVVGKGMAQYMAGEAVGMKKYANGPEKALVGDQVNLNESLKKAIEAAPEKKSPKQMGEMEEAPMSTGPAKRTRAERQADRDSKKTTRRAKRADKRVKRNEDKVKKLESKIDQGKENFNVDDAGNKTTGRKANRIERAKKKIEDNKKISKKGKDSVVEEDSSSGKGGMMKAGDRKKVKKVNKMSNRRRKDTYSYQEPKAKVLKK